MVESREPCPDVFAPLGTTMDEATVHERPGVRVMMRDSAEAIAHEARMRGVTWAWVEGFSEAGKSTFAYRLAHAMGWQTVMSLDNMALEMGKQPPDSPRYADHLDRDRILAVINSGVPLVVEGVCLRDAVEGMRADATLRIYIARVSRPGTGALIWHDAVEMEEPARARDNWLVRDVFDYHRRVQPHASSEFVLVRIEDDVALR